MEKNIKFICDIRMQKFTIRILNKALTSIRQRQSDQPQRIRKPIYPIEHQKKSQFNQRNLFSITPKLKGSRLQWQSSRSKYEPNGILNTWTKWNSAWPTRKKENCRYGHARLNPKGIGYPFQKATEECKDNNITYITERLNSVTIIPQMTAIIIFLG